MPGMTRSAVGASVSAVATLLLLAGSASADGLAGTVAKLDAPRAELARAATNAVPGGGQIRHYQQKVGGLPVFGAEAVVVVPPGADSIVVSDTTTGGVSWSNASGAISSAKAIAAARSATGAKRLRAKASAKLGLDKATGDLVWQVELPSGKPLADYVVDVDARSGEEAAVQGRAPQCHRRCGDLQPEPGCPAGQLLGSQGQERQGHIAADLTAHAGCARADHRQRQGVSEGRVRTRR